MAWRKSWSKENIYGKTGNGDCTKRKLLPEERSVLDDYLDLAEISPVKGSVCIAKDIGYTIEQLSQILNTPSEIIINSENKLQQTGVIKIVGRVITFLKWFHYQSEYGRQLQYRVTKKGYNKKLQDRDTKNASDSVSDSVSINNKEKGVVGEKDFDELWQKYPVKDGRKAALRFFRASVLTEQDLKDIWIAIENYLRSGKVLKGFIKNGSTWFNNWKDWIGMEEKQPYENVK